MKWQLFHAGNFVLLWNCFFLFPEWELHLQELILTKWHYSNIFLQKLKSLISFFHEEVFLKCEIHIKVIVSNVCRILGSSLMKYSRSIGITHYCLSGFIIQEIQGKVGMLCFFSRYILGLSWMWLIMYFQYKAFFFQESGLGNIQSEDLILCWLFFPLQCFRIITHFCLWPNTLFLQATEQNRTWTQSPYLKRILSCFV